MIYEVTNTISFDENGNMIYDKDNVNSYSVDSSANCVLKSGDTMTGTLITPQVDTTLISFFDNTTQSTAFSSTLKTNYDNYDTRITTNTNDIALLNTTVASLQTTDATTTEMNNEIENLKNIVWYYKNTQTINLLPYNTLY